jgi:hypothetical protein
MKTLRRLTMSALLTSLLFTSLAIQAVAWTAPVAANTQVSNPWFLEATLSGTGDLLQLGFSLSMSNDTIVSSSNGQVFVYVRKGGHWTSMTQTAVLTASDGAYLGAVSISEDTIVAGAPGANNDAGGAYVFVKPSGGWTNTTETAKLSASDGINGDFIGHAVSITANTIALGATENNSVGSRYPEPNGPGAVYVYSKPSSGWADATETAKLTASDGITGDDLGYSVAVLGDTIAAGAPNAAIGSTELEGAVYVFQKAGSHWVTATQTGKLTASDGGEISVVGISLGISGNTIAAAAFDKVYIFNRPSSGWKTATQNAELADTSSYFFGLNSVAICDQFVLAGSPSTTNHPIADLYVKPAAGWTDMSPNYRFKVPAGNGNGAYGWSAAVNGTTLVIGSPLNAGAGGNLIYVYRLN